MTASSFSRPPTATPDYRQRGGEQTDLGRGDVIAPLHIEQPRKGGEKRSEHEHHSLPHTDVVVEHLGALRVLTDGKHDLAVSRVHEHPTAEITNQRQDKREVKK